MAPVLWRLTQPSEGILYKQRSLINIIKKLKGKKHVCEGEWGQGVVHPASESQRWLQEGSNL